MREKSGQFEGKIRLACKRKRDCCYSVKTLLAENRIADVPQNSIA